MKRMVFKGSNDTSSPIYRNVPVAASQTIVKGSIVLKKTGKATSATAAATSADEVWGVAAAGITTGGSVGDDDMVLIDVNPNSIYEMPHTDGTKKTVTNSDIGKAFGLSNAFTADLDNTTDGLLECVGFSSDRKTIAVQIKGRVPNN